LQISHEDERDAGYVFKIIIVGFYLAFHMKCVGYFGDDDITRANVDEFFVKTNVAVVTVIALILRHVQSCSCNGYEISELVRNQKAIMVTTTWLVGVYFTQDLGSRDNCHMAVVSRVIIHKQSTNLLKRSLGR